MRELKFRAWDKKKKEMLNINDLECWRTKPVFDVENCLCVYLGEGEELRRLEVMQFTGLKDKHGNRIYEGDIIQWTDGYEGLRAEVYFNQDDATFRMRNISEKEELLFEDEFGHDEIEIIGNIYGNPELLKDDVNCVKPVVEEEQ